MFPELPQHVSFPDLEREVLQFWNERQIYQQSLLKRRNGRRFVFYEGPPTANGLPHPGHCLTRAVKDLFPRYRTMRGDYCQRKAGWDTHGLPVETEVCKELGIHSKEDIERFGVEPFIHRCQQSVWRYVQQWEQVTERIGFWVDLDQAYVTYHQSYVESVWWSLKCLFQRGLLYQGYKIVWWWAQGGTALSSGEVGQGYRRVADPSVYVLFPMLDEHGQVEAHLLVWTTTPWTLPSNQFAAVHPDVTYVKVRDPQFDRPLILAEPLLATLAGKVQRELTVEGRCLGRDLVGRRYRPPFLDYWNRLGAHTGTLKDGGQEPVAWRVVAADLVTVDTGTGIVHQAPAFGEVDFDVLLREQQRFVEGQGPELLCAVGPDGRFTSEAPAYEGQWVKDADKMILRDLRQLGLLWHQEQILHEYPFCWRAEEDPLIQYPRRSWFVRTTEFKQRMLANNRHIDWLPEHIRDGRFGNFLESNVDWALSRERYWGTPLPIWQCEATGKMEAIGSYAELLEKPGVDGMQVWEEAKRTNPELVDDLKVHKPYIDAITYDSPFAAGARMRRVPEVIDCWYDSGAMPFAQWGYPHRGAEEFQAQFPADFISEAIDQTRGWFYSLLAISTLMFGPEGAATEGEAAPFPHPFRNCIVLGLLLGEDGEKMSKSKRNYREPQEIFDRYGADALRWYFFANQPPWTTIRYSEQAIKDSIPEFLLRLWNVFSFFTIYANIDQFDPGQQISGDLGQLDPSVLAQAATYRPVSQRNELDRWILSELYATAREIVERMDRYDNYTACQRLHAFVDALSNWYVRRSRSRFWASDPHSPDKLDAYWTLYECLLTSARLAAPFVPFLSEFLWRKLTAVFPQGVVESVHLCDYPTGEGIAVDRTLQQQMELAREVASLGRSARMQAKLKVRQPLRRVLVVLASDEHQAWLEAHCEVIREELNVKQVEFPTNADQYIHYEVVPNFKALGPRLGPLMPRVKQALAQADGAALRRQLDQQGEIQLDVDGQTVKLSPDDVQIRLQAKSGWTAAPGRQSVVILSTDLDPQLVREGFARDLVRLIQERRKELGLQYTDRIHVGVDTQASEILTAMEENRGFIMEETLAVELVATPIAGTTPVKHEVNGLPIDLYVQNSVSR